MADQELIRIGPVAEYYFVEERVAGVPHMLQFINSIPGHDFMDVATLLAVDMRQRVAEAVVRYTGWDIRRAKRETKGRLVASGGREGYSNGRVINWMRDLDGQMLLEILADIQQNGSNPDMDFYEVIWEFWIVPQSIVGGASRNVRKPSWHTQTEYSRTWQGYEDEEGDISCAAYSICYGMYSSLKSKHYERKRNCIRDARNLMKELGWDAFVSFNQLQNFVDHYPTKKLVVINPFAIGAIGVFYGKEFDISGSEKELINDTIFLTYDSQQNHYGGTKTPNIIIRNAHAKTWQWCHQCDSCYSCATKQEHECEDARRRYYPQKSRTCGGCNSIVTGRCYQCDGRECMGCGSEYKNNTFHRCLFMTRKAMNSSFQNEDIDIDVEEDEFLKYPENEYRILFADLESAMHKIEGTQKVIEQFYFDENGKYVTDEENVSLALHGYSYIEQRANYCYVEDGCDDSVEKMFRGERCLDEFLDWITQYNDGKNIVLFHYGSGYDARLIFAAAQKTFKTQLKNPIVRGTKFLELKVGNVIFRDSILHLPGSLDSLGKAFKPPGGLVKGHFPILFNYQENVGKVFDSIPDLKYFAVPRDQRAFDELKKWHSTWTGPWDFSKEIEKYVIADVKVLKFVGMEFHKTLVRATGASPWYRATAPSFTHEFLKLEITKLMQLPKYKSPGYHAAIQDRVPDFWPILDEYEDAFARKCLRGGRTDVKQMRRYLTEDEIKRGCRIKYIDVNSMYPAVQMAKKFPVGLPRIEIYDPKYIPCRTHKFDSKCDCPPTNRPGFGKFKYHYLDQLTTQSILADETFFGFGVFTTIPPKDIFTPLTVCYSESDKKCLGTLRDEDHVEKYDTSESLKLMLRNGYKLIKVHAFHRYKAAESMWKRAGFGDLILQKMIVSGYAPESMAERKYLEDIYEERFGMGDIVRNSWDKWCPDKAKKIIYKVVINSAWGKHVQKLIQSECQVINHETDLTATMDFWRNILAGNYEFKSGTFLSGGSLVNRFERKKEKLKLDLHNCYVPAAIFVPEYGRIQLVEKLMELKEPLYHDTDSVIYVHDPMRDGELEVSDILGDWGEEDISLENEHGGIMEFIAMGPKSYGLKCRDGYTMIKAKGVKMNHATSDIFNYDVMKYLVDEHLDEEKNTTIQVRFLLIIDSFSVDDF